MHRQIHARELGRYELSLMARLSPASLINTKQTALQLPMELSTADEAGSIWFDAPV
jgi:hypothetical protein